MTFDPAEVTIGIEEEYLLVDLETRNLATEPPSAMLEECEALSEGRVSPEFLKSQIEVGTKVCTTVQEAREDLRALRAMVTRAAGRHGLAPIAASTHPFAQWQEQKHTEKERYNVLARDLAAVARRLLICGMHVHVGIADEDTRIDLMNQVSYFLPHLLALSTSSPFWRGEETGLRSFRLTVFDGLPRTGLPDHFESFGEYQRLVDRMVQAGLVEDATKLWWDLRPSARYPTLEMRMTDVCTRLDDAVTVAALFLCLLSMLSRLRANNQRWRIYPRSLVQENRWLAQRYGSDGELVDFGKGIKVPFTDLVEEIIELVAEDAERLGCVDEILNVREIVRRGTSAHRQLAAFHAAREAGVAEDEALRRVVDMLIEDSAIGIES